MTLQNLRDLFVSRLMLEHSKLGIEMPELQEGVIAFLISEAQNDLIKRLNVIKSYTDIQLIKDTLEYALPSKFGKFIHAEMSGERIPATGITELSDIKSPLTIAVYYSESGYKLRLNGSSTGTLRVWYYADTNLFNPANTQAQDWGQFDGNTFTGNLLVPERYTMAVLYYMLKESIPNPNGFEIKYDRAVLELQTMTGSTAPKFDYNQNIPIR